MMRKYIFILKANIGKIMAIAFIFIFFAMKRMEVQEESLFMKMYYDTFNERRFLSIYLTLYLILLFPIIKKVQSIEYITRYSRKWDCVIVQFFKILKVSLLYSFVIAFGWYFLIGAFCMQGMEREHVILICCITFTQVIGWTLMGMIEMVVYIFLKNIVLSFLLCDALFILTNLSLYVTSSLQFVHFVRVYDFMFDIGNINNPFILVSILFFYIAIIMGLIWFSYFAIAKQDFLAKEASGYAKK